jgi:hypothetical protein
MTSCWTTTAPPPRGAHDIPLVLGQLLQIGLAAEFRAFEAETVLHPRSGTPIRLSNEKRAGIAAEPRLKQYRDKTVI